MSGIPTLFADGVTEASIRHGVARLTLALQDGKGQAQPTGVIAVPVGQLPIVVAAMTRLMREMETKLREAQPASDPPSPPPEPDAFHFQP